MNYFLQFEANFWSTQRVAFWMTASSGILYLTFYIMVWIMFNSLVIARVDEALNKIYLLYEWIKWMNVVDLCLIRYNSFFFFLSDPQESQCSAEFEWHTEVICMKHANSQNASRENASSSRILLEQFSPSHGKHPYLNNIKFRMQRYVNIK